jgi:molybdopterin/thiamine biosynthesis adenylyltransferase
VAAASTDRYSRNEGLLGADGQRALAATSVAIAGLGGLGSHVAQQLAYLGVHKFALIDHDIVTASSMNRVVIAHDADVAARTSKVDAARRLILAVQPTAEVQVSSTYLNDPRAQRLLARTDVVFGCVDNDLARLHLSGICSRHARPMLDLATDTHTEGEATTYGGRVVYCAGRGCLVCLQVLNQETLARASFSESQHSAHRQIYGVTEAALEGTGPMVVSINGVVASLAITEFIAHVTGLRPVIPHLIYLGHKGQIRQNQDPAIPDCYYCTGLWGLGVASAL